MHHLFQLLKIEEHLSEYEKMKLYSDLNDISTAYPRAMEEYLWIERAVHLINSLIMKWNVVDVKNYAYRNEKR
jgi:hypothetical protein